MDNTLMGINEKEIVDAFTSSKFRKELLNTLFYILRNNDDAQDVAQTTFIKCWNKKELWKEVNDLRSWIFRIAINTAKDVTREFWKRKFCELPAEGMFLESRSDFLSEIDYKEKIDSVSQAMTCLNQEEKEVFLLRQNDELTCKEISKLKGVPVGTVKSRMRSALMKIRKTFE